MHLYVRSIISATICFGLCSASARSASLSSASCDDKRVIISLMQGFNQMNTSMARGISIIDVKQVTTISRSDTELKCRGLIVASDGVEDYRNFRFFFNSVGEILFEITL